MPIPTRRFASLVALAAIVLVVVGNGTVFLVVNTALVAVALVDALLAQGASVRVDRELPEVLALGATATVVWRVENVAGRGQTVALADELAPSLRASTRRVRMRVRAHTTIEASATISPTRRGRFDIRAVSVRVDGPLGLAARQRVVALPAVLRVYPPFRSRDEAELRINKARILEVGLRSAQGRGGGTEFDQLREYSASIGPRPPAPGGPSSGRIVPNEIRPLSHCSTTGASWQAASMAYRVSSTPWTQ